jgi:hypothetical protein
MLAAIAVATLFMGKAATAAPLAPAQIDRLETRVQAERRNTTLCRNTIRTGRAITAGMIARATTCVRAIMPRIATIMRQGVIITIADRKPRSGGVFFWSLR